MDIKSLQQLATALLCATTVISFSVKVPQVDRTISVARNELLIVLSQAHRSDSLLVSEGTLSLGLSGSSGAHLLLQ